jgi:hypothetical protein
MDEGRSFINDAEKMIVVRYFAFFRFGLAFASGRQKSPLSITAPCRSFLADIVGALCIKYPVLAIFCAG